MTFSSSSWEEVLDDSALLNKLALELEANIHLMSSWKS